MTYIIPALTNTNYRVTAEVCYQSVKPQLVDHIRQINNGDINKFVNMYDALPNIPFIMKREVFDIVTNVEAENLAVIDFSIDQNYPNPFNPRTTISWQSPVSSHQTLKVYDVLGNEVASLVDEFKEAGSYEISFDASFLSSGVYFYKLQAGDFSQIKKMVLMR